MTCREREKEAVMRGSSEPLWGGSHECSPHLPDWRGQVELGRTACPWSGWSSHHRLGIEWTVKNRLSGRLGPAPLWSVCRECHLRMLPQDNCMEKGVFSR